MNTGTGLHPPQRDRRYRKVWDPERRAYVYEHRLVVERLIGQRLTSDKIVHHINGDGLDNRAENLQVTTRSEHQRLHGFDYLRAERPHMQRPKVPCPICGQPFKPKRRTLPDGSSVDTATCSQSCGQRFRHVRHD